MTNLTKKVASLFIGVLFIWTMTLANCFQVFALEKYDNDYKPEKSSANVLVVSDSVFLIKEASVISAVEVRRGVNTTQTIVKDLQGRVDGYFLANETTGTVYSSYTGTSTPIEEILVDDTGLMLAEQTVNQVNGAVPKTLAPAKASTKPKDVRIGSATKRISYRTIANQVGKTASIVTIAAFCVSVLAAAGFTVLTAVAVVAKKIANGVGVIAAFLTVAKPPSNHGIVLHLTKYRKYKLRSGHYYAYIACTVDKVTRY